MNYLIKKRSAPLMAIFVTCGFISLGLQLINILFFPEAIRGDEFFQYLEPAHFLIDGHWVTTWEWPAEIRSWVVPGTIALLMKGANMAGFLNPVYAVRFIFSLFFLPVIFLFILLGKRIGGMGWAWIFGLAASFWPDYAMLAYHTAGDTLGAVFVLGGVLLGCLLLLEKEGGRLGEKADKKQRLYWFFTGLSFGIAGMVRFQLLPEIGLGLLLLSLMCWNMRGIWLAGAGFLIPLGLLGVVDWISFGMPYLSIFKNYYINQTLHKADDFGVFPALFYVDKTFVRFRVTAILSFLLIIAGLASTGRKRLIFPLFLFILIIAAHSAIAHKEYSFIFAALFLVPLLCLLSLSGIWQCFHQKLLERLSPKALKLLLFFCAGAGAVSFMIRAHEAGARYHDKMERGFLILETMAYGQSDLCALGVLENISLQKSFHIWSWTGGYAWNASKKPLYFAYDRGEFETVLPRLNYFIAPPEIESFFHEHSALQKLQKRACVQDEESTYCLYHLPAPCAEPDYDQFSKILQAHGE